MSAAERICHLGQHRLWPVAELLAARGLLATDLAVACRALAERGREALAWVGDREARLLAALAPLRTLTLKGAMLARTEYDHPETRHREDCDLLVAPADVAAAEALLAAIGYRRSTVPEGGTPLRQVALQYQEADRRHVVDLHWDLSNHPALQGLLDFEALWSRSRSVDSELPFARGLGRADALLHAAIHYFGHQRAQFRPLQWVLDVDLLWRHADPEEREQATALARDLGLSALLAEMLDQARFHFATPVSEALLLDLRESGRGQWRSHLVQPYRSQWREQWLLLRSLPDWPRRLAHLRALLFPPAAYMRARYPEGHWLGVAGLYWRRIRQGIAGRRGG